MVSFCEFIQVSEEGCAGEASVGRYDGVASFAADGQGAAGQVACGFLEDVFIGRVVDGDFDVDLGDLDVAHHAVACEVQAGEVFFAAFFGDLGGGEGVGEDVGV